MMKDQRLSLQQAAAALKLFADDPDAEEAIALLIKANLVNSDLYSRAVRMQMQHRMGPLKALVASQLLSPMTHKAAISAQKNAGRRRHQRSRSCSLLANRGQKALHAYRSAFGNSRRKQKKSTRC